MKYKSDNEELMVKYLLGQLSEEDQAQVEERFIRDSQYLERLRAIEEDLNDNYVRGEMPDSEREQFEKRISASPEWRQRVEFARALTAIGTVAPQSAVAPAEAQPEFWWRSLLAFLRAQNLAFNFALAAVAIAILVAGSWLVLETRRLSAELEQFQAERQQIEQRDQQLRQQTADERARADKLAQDLERERVEREQLETELEKSPTPTPSIISFILTPGVGRGEEESTKLVVPRDASLVRLNLYLQGPTPYKSYRAELRAAGGKPVWSRNTLTTRQTTTGKTVALSLPAEALTPGKYEVALKGVISKDQSEDVGYYYFSVVKK